MVTICSLRASEKAISSQNFPHGPPSPIFTPWQSPFFFNNQAVEEQSIAPAMALKPFSLWSLPAAPFKLTAMRLTVHGKHFHFDGRPYFLRTVTYGPFPPDSLHHPATDFPLVQEARFNSVRVYSLPDRALLDAAHENNLIIIPTHAWGHGCDFIEENPDIFTEAKGTLLGWLTRFHNHPALGALLVGNEIPSDMARWMTPWKVNRALDDLIRACQDLAPNLPVGYANFPTTEYLEPPSADFTAFNIYLEDSASLSSYLPRLHHLAGDRPVYLTEFGLDTIRHSETEQAEIFTHTLQLARYHGLAGATFYAWSDEWFNNGKVMDDWAFGMIRRDGSTKPALPVLRETILFDPLPEKPLEISVIICTRNGAERLPACLEACRHIDYPKFEIIVVNDGSTDNTAEVLAGYDDIFVFNIPPSGLSVARNVGAENARGKILAFTDDDCRPDSQWLTWLAHSYEISSHAAIGGPNLPPKPDSLPLALTTAAPGAPTHVMLDDTNAEHLPGCHLSVKKTVFDAVGGFDPIFHTAGDDVDFCWRLRDAGYTLGFSPASFVWHHRRATPWKYLKQQIGYGRAEALLYQKHQHRFSTAGIRWEGCVYRGRALGVEPGDFIYAGPTGEEPYQSLGKGIRQPMRGLHCDFDHTLARVLLTLLSFLQSQVRYWTRRVNGGPTGMGRWRFRAKDPKIKTRVTLNHPDGHGRHELYRHLLENEWEPCPDPHFDLQRGRCQLLAATEQTGTPVNRTFVALTEQAGDLFSLAKSVGFSPASEEGQQLLKPDPFQ